jgi:hypothetical protein
LIDAASVVPPGFAADADPLDAAAGVRPAVGCFYCHCCRCWCCSYCC